MPNMPIRIVSSIGKRLIDGVKAYPQLLHTWMSPDSILPPGSGSTFDNTTTKFDDTTHTWDEF